MTHSRSKNCWWLLWLVRAIVLVVVVAGVSGTLRGAVARLGSYHWQLEPAWLVAAAAFYILGLAPMAWFWHRVLMALGQAVPGRDALWAYYLGHLGKYSPGKALVVVLRVAAVRAASSSTWLVVVSTLIETLTMMSVGAFLAAATAAAAFGFSSGITPLAVLAAVVIVLPTMPPVARRLARFGLTRFRPGGSHLPNNTTQAAIDIEHAVVDRLTWHLWASGWAASLVCWTLLGLSLWATLRSIGVENIRPLADLPIFVGAVSLAVVAGFVSMLPGGVGVRDMLLVQLLAPVCGDDNALIAAVLLRIVWLLSELVVCVILYGARGARRNG